MSHMSAKVVVLGDVCLDTFLEISEKDAATYCDIDTHACTIQLQYGAKIPVASRQVGVGGNAANAAVSLSKLGVPAYVVAAVAHDPEGERIAADLQSAGVMLPDSFLGGAPATNANTVLRYRGERTILSQHVQRAYDPAALPDSAPMWLYITSMRDGYEDLVAAALQRYPKASVLFQPGTLQLRQGATAHQQILDRHPVIVMNREEAEQYTGKTQKPDLAGQAALVVALLRLGASAAIVTDGARGAVAADGEGLWALPVPDTAPAPFETTGAGDGYTSAVVAALMHGGDLSDALRWGQVQATAVVAQVGAQAGLSDLSALQRNLAAIPFPTNLMF
jgi:ribokinase